MGTIGGRSWIMVCFLLASGFACLSGGFALARNHGFSHDLRAKDLEKTHPGAVAYVPTRIEWLTVSLQAALRDYSSLDQSGYLLDITNPDSETVMIFVRYTPDVKRDEMNLAIDTAHKVIKTTAESYGWDRWLKVKEQVERVESSAAIH